MADSNSTTPQSPPEPDLSGRQLGDYRLLRRLGRGGMAEVYLAEQASLQRQVAFKVLKRALAVDESYVRRFHNEAQAAAALVQANIVQIYEVGCIDDVHFIAQEYVAGQNLNQFLARNGPLDAPRAAVIMRQMAAALHKAAQQGIVHRDIKPENILLAPNGEVKVADFGLARVIGNGDKVDMTQVGVTMGTPLYMSPEQVEGRALDPRSDLYSMGVTCYQMLAGRTPFEGETALAVAVQHLHNEPTRLESQRDDLPEGLCRIVHKMLAKDPEKRFQNATELLRELRALSIEGDEAATEEMAEWNTAELAAMSDARTAATQKLGVVMQTQALQQQQGRRGWLLLALLVPTAFLVGGSVAWLTQPASLLEIDENQLPKIEKMETPKAQFDLAIFMEKKRSEEAFRAVWENFPPDKQHPENLYYGRLAKQRLAEFYLDENNLPAAEKIFAEFAALGSSEPQFQAFGLAGQAIVYDRLQKRDEAAKLLVRLTPLRRHLNPTMSTQIEEIARRYQGRSNGS